MPERIDIDPSEEDEIYDEFGNREFGGTYFTIIKNGERLYFERTPGGITERISERDYTTAPKPGMRSFAKFRDPSRRSEHRRKRLGFAVATITAIL